MRKLKYIYSAQYTAELIGISYQALIRRINKFDKLIDWKKNKDNNYKFSELGIVQLRHIQRYNRMRVDKRIVAFELERVTAKFLLNH